jgi:hypothetical protein
MAFIATGRCAKKNLKVVVSLPRICALASEEIHEERRRLGRFRTLGAGQDSCTKEKSLETGKRPQPA